MHIYSNTVETYVHRIYSAGQPVDPDANDVVFEYTAPDGEFYYDYAQRISEGVYSISIFPSKYDGESLLSVKYQIDGREIEERRGLIFAPPYVDMNILQSLLPDDSYDDRKSKERLVSSIINSYCGIPFGFYKETMSFNGHDGDSIHLPARVVSLDSVKVGEYDITEYVEVSETNWSIRRKSGVIQSPFFIDRNLFKSKFRYEITGEFGWPFVPPEISQAAEILIEDYEENEAKWREKNVNVIRAADWRMEFADKPIQTTGNINADILISRFAVPHWAVI